MATVQDQIKVFDSNDKPLKILGELLSNETSRKIIKCLIEKEMYTNEISTKLNIRVSLVIFHLRKLEELGLLEITHKQIVRKGNEHRYFRMVPSLLILPNESKDELEKKSILKRIFNTKIKFGIIGMIATFSFILFDLKYIYNPENTSYASEVPFLLLPSIIVGTGIGIKILWSIKKKID